MNNIVEKVFTLRKGGENGNEFFITLGNVLISKELHKTEEEAWEELSSIDLETLTKVIIAIANATEAMIKNYNNNNENEN